MKLLADFLDSLDRITGLLLDYRKAILCQVIEMLGNDHPHLLRHVHVRSDLVEQAFLQVSSRNSGRFHRLDNRQCSLGQR